MNLKKLIIYWTFDNFFKFWYKILMNIFENTFINYENDYDIINEIIQELNIDKYNIEFDIAFIKQYIWLKYKK